MPGVIENGTCDKLCTSVKCLEDAYEIKRAMDLNVDPCDNFYQFACGRFIKESRIPEDKSEVTIFTTIG